MPTSQNDPGNIGNWNPEYVQSFSNGSFSGADMVATIVFPNSKPIKLGEMSTATYSVYREKHPVRTLSRINVKGFTKGPRTVAGTLIFTVFEKHIVNTIRQKVDYLKNLNALKVDELPPFDLYITMGNEYGSTSRLNIYGITVVDEGKVFSVEDMFTENQWSYMARDIVLMDDLGAEQNRPTTEWATGEATGAFTLDDLVLDDKYAAMLAEIERLKNERDAAIAEARKKALEKYTETIDPFDMEDIYDESDGIDPDAVNHPELAFEHRYFSNWFTKGFEWEAKAKHEKNRIVVVYVDNPGEGDKMDIQLLEGAEITISLNLNGENKSYTAKIKNSHVIFEIHKYYDWKPQIMDLKVFTHLSSTTKGGNTFILLSPKEVQINNDATGARFGEEIVFSYGLKGGSTDKAQSAFKDLKVHLDISTYGLNSTTKQVNGCTAVETFRDAYTDGNSVGDEDDAKYFTTRWVVPGNVPNSLPGVTKVNKERCKTGFVFKLTNVTKEGKPYNLTASDMRQLRLKCDYKIDIYLYDTWYTLDGARENGNLNWIGTDAMVPIRRGAKFEIDEMCSNAGRTLYLINEDSLNMGFHPERSSGIVNMIVNFGHKANFTSLKHSDMHVILYNFRLIYEGTNMAYQLTTSQSEARYVVTDLDIPRSKQLFAF